MNFNLVPKASDLATLTQKKGLKPLIIADSHVVDIHGLPFEAPLFTFPMGEIHKNRETKASLEDALLKHGIDSKSCIVGYGGGVALDLAGFIAATLHRGLFFASIPTTLLAMCDACLGGKNGLNTPYGKNLIGTIHHPEVICIDSHYLTTLDEHQLKSGEAEMIKHALLSDPTLLEKPITDELIVRNLEIKRSFVEGGADWRHCLNFGHTVGHALEALSGYRLSHGSAVLKGMWIEVLLGPMQNPDVIAPYLDTSPIPYSVDAIWEQMLRDKKCENGEVFCSTIKKPGSPIARYLVTKEALADVLSDAHHQRS